MKQATIRMAGSDVAEILVYDQIGKDFFSDGIDAKEFRRQIKAVKAKTINLRINSPGGSVTDAAAMAAALDDHPARIEVDVDGIAASAASVLAVVGDVVRMSASGLMMIHNPYAMTAGGSDEMRRMADLLDSVKGQILDRYERKAGKITPRDKLAQMMADETWFTGEEAVAAGLADEVTAARQVAACVSAEALAKMGYRRVPAEKLQAWGEQQRAEHEKRRAVAARL